MNCPIFYHWYFWKRSAHEMDSLHFKGKWRGSKSLNTLGKTQTHFIIILLYILRNRSTYLARGDWELTGFKKKGDWSEEKEKMLSNAFSLLELDAADGSESASASASAPSRRKKKGSTSTSKANTNTTRTNTQGFLLYQNSLFFDFTFCCCCCWRLLDC